MGIIDRITGRGRTPVQDTRSALERAQTTNDPGVVGGSLTKFVDTLLDAGIDGRGPFDPARQVADEALRANGGDAEKAIDAIVRKHITLAAGNGFLTSLGGFITMPVALPANVLGFYLETESGERDTDVRRHRFIDDPPVLWHVPDDVKADVMRGVQEYVPTLRESRHELLARFRMSDVAFRVVGTGSVGMRTFVVLLHGNDEEDVVLQVKQAGRSALAGALGESACEHEGRRIVEGARAVQSETDILMGWTTIRDRHYVVRQFRNLKGSLEPTELPAKLLDDYGRLTGALLARAHVRTLHPAVLDGYLEDDKDIDEAIGSFAVEYADRTEADHAELVTAIKAGRLPCDDGSQG